MESVTRLDPLLQSHLTIQQAVEGSNRSSLSISILATLIRSRRLQGSTNSNWIEDPHPFHHKIKYKYTPFADEKGVAPLILRAHTAHTPYHTTLAVFLCQSTTATLTVFLCQSSPFTDYWFSRLRVLGWHHTGATNLKVVFRACSDR